MRIYNEQPTYPLRNPREFCQGLLSFVGSEAQYLFTASHMADAEGKGEQMKKRLQNTRIALQALRNVLKNNTGTEQLCKGNFKLLFSLLQYDTDSGVQLLALEVLSIVTANRDCVADIANAQVLVYLFFAMQTLPGSQLLALETLHALVSHPKIVAEVQQVGGLLYVLGKERIKQQCRKRKMNL